MKLLHYRNALLQAKSIYFLSRCLLRTFLLHTKLHFVLVDMVGVTMIKNMHRLWFIIKCFYIFVCLVNKMTFACLNLDFHLFVYLGLIKFEIMPKILHYFSMNILGNFIGSPLLLSKWVLIQWTQALLKL